MGIEIDRDFTFVSTMISPAKLKGRGSAINPAIQYSYNYNYLKILKMCKIQ